MLPAVAGFVLGIGLIVSIGPQNLFLIKESVHGSRRGLCIFMCVLCDAVLIVGSVLGLGYLLARSWYLHVALLLGGVAFLVWYGFGSFREGLLSWRGNVGGSNEPVTKVASGALPLVLMAMSFSVLNPQAIIDSMVIIGGASAQYHGRALMDFLVGVLLASVVWFSGLSWVASRFSGFLKRPRVWAVLSFVSAGIMFLVSAMLLQSLFVQL